MLCSGHQFLTFYLTRFEKVITIRDKLIRHRQRGTRYRRRVTHYKVVDLNNTIYQLDNLWFFGDFKRSDDYVDIESRKSYIIQGYGYRWALLGIYPKIYSFVPTTTKQTSKQPSTHNPRRIS